MLRQSILPSRILVVVWDVWEAIDEFIGQVEAEDEMVAEHSKGAECYGDGCEGDDRP